MKGTILLLTAIAVPVLASPAVPEKLLVESIRSSDYGKLKSLLDNDTDPNYRLADGSTPLTWAVETQNADMAKLLLKAGADTETSNPYTPLIIACQHGNVDILNSLLDADADVNAPGPQSIPPLSVCAGTAPLKILKRMVKNGAVIDKADNNGQTPLMWAAANGRLDNINYLIKQGAEVNRTTANGFTPLFFAIKSGNAKAAKSVLNMGGDGNYVTPDGTSAVQLAMYQENYDFAIYLIEQGVDLNAFDRNGNQLLHAAVQAEQPALVKLLLDKGAKVNTPTGESKVKWRFESNFKTGDYKVPPKSPLLLAAEKGSVPMMQMLVEAGADTGFRSEEGNNIVLAATNRKPDALALALELEPDPNTANNYGQTPLHLLLGGGTDYVRTDAEMLEMFKLLAARGARADIKNSEGLTPAEIAQDDNFRGKAVFNAIFNVDNPE